MNSYAIFLLCKHFGFSVLFWLTKSSLLTN